MYVVGGFTKSPKHFFTSSLPGRQMCRCFASSCFSSFLVSWTHFPRVDRFAENFTFHLSWSPGSTTLPFPRLPFSLGSLISLDWVWFETQIIGFQWVFVIFSPAQQISRQNFRRKHFSWWFATFCRGWKFGVTQSFVAYLVIREGLEEKTCSQQQRFLKPGS